MAQYSKLWVALVGLVILLLLPVASQKFGVNFDQQTQFVIQAIVSALTAAGVYQAKNKED